MTRDRSLAVVGTSQIQQQSLFGDELEYPPSRLQISSFGPQTYRLSHPNWNTVALGTAAFYGQTQPCKGSLRRIQSELGLCLGW